jgi:hypothetical protein
LINAGEINDHIALLAQKSRGEIFVFLELSRASGGEFGGQFWGERQIHAPPFAASTMLQKGLIARRADWETHFNCSLAAKI